MHRLISIALLGFSCVIHAQSPLLLTGQLQTREKQHFIAPHTKTWRVQIEWMMPEGSVAQPGDIVVVFDGGSIQSSIDSLTSQLNTQLETLQKQEIEQQQNVIEKEFGLRRAELQLQKAEVDAGVPEKFLSSLDYENFQLEKKKAETEVQKAREQLQQAQLAKKVALEKQRLTIANTERSLANEKEQLERMSQRADRVGPVVYGKHPWRGDPIYVGMTVNPNWEIAQIPALTDTFVEVWVHEVDVDRLASGQGANLVFDAFPGLALEAELVAVETQPEKMQAIGPGLYYRAEFAFEAPETKTLLPGMSARLEMELELEGRQ
ncbi:HlyD family secretion protein [Biformimicrobium ophioploci]|uniref:HlyD family secretion protein n=1 Tax=Biformimicrobium ophioploci TaxID=3036711 RepID=A0ABQ6LY86_9GAMM|nr:HlyD family efflux transporter periplasmic adaptor subunit [Microbulbifer sp. NKW57]GMG87063.1 hypothetical protein MNKW57_13840 [Microbulbifer sp. NKW57]